MGQLIWSSKAFELFGDGSKVDQLPTSFNLLSPTSDLPTVIPDWKPYVSDVITEEDGHTPVVIQSRSDYKEQLKRRGLECVDSGKPFVSKQEARRRQSKRVFRLKE